jgi:hypothetical protein
MAKIIDVKKNIARAAAEKHLRKIADNRLKRAAAVISGARNIAVSIVGLEAAEELLLNEIHALRDDRAHEEIVRSLKG